MAINVSSLDGEDEIVSAINTTPLVDVMLVLLIIFLITIPVVRSIPVELPKERNHAQQTKPENINIAITRDGSVYWNERPLASNAELLEKLKTIAVIVPQPAVQIRGDGNATYEPVGRVVLASQRAGIQKIGFITEPPPRN